MRKIKWLRARTRDDHAEVLAITLNQKRYDDAGNRMRGYSYAEIAAMNPYERQTRLVRRWREMNVETLRSCTHSPSSSSEAVKATDTKPPMNRARTNRRRTEGSAMRFTALRIDGTAMKVNPSKVAVRSSLELVERDESAELLRGLIHSIRDFLAREEAEIFRIAPELADKKSWQPLDGLHEQTKNEAAERRLRTVGALRFLVDAHEEEFQKILRKGTNYAPSRETR